MNTIQPQFIKHLPSYLLQESKRQR